MITTSTKRWTVTALTTAVVLICAADPASAQQPTTSPTTAPAVSGSWSVTPFAGFGFSGDLDGATGAIGVAGGYGWSPTISLEGEFNLLSSSENGGLSR